MIRAGRIAFCLGLLASPAAGADMLTVYGAWVMANEQCGRIFARDGDRIVFGGSRAEPLPGIILDSDSISNNEYLCRVREFTVKDNEVSFRGRCEVGRRTRNTRFSLRELNGSYKLAIDREAFDIKRCPIGEMKDLAAVQAERERFSRENATALEKSRGFWASRPEMCATAFQPDGEGGFRVAPEVADPDVAVIISDNRFITRGSVCTSQQVVSDLKTGTEYSGNYLCAAEGREFPTTERIKIIDKDAIERTPTSRQPLAQRLARCAPPAGEKTAAQPPASRSPLEASGGERGAGREPARR